MSILYLIIAFLRSKNYIAKVNSHVQSAICLASSYRQQFFECLLPFSVSSIKCCANIYIREIKFYEWKYNILSTACFNMLVSTFLIRFNVKYNFVIIMVFFRIVDYFKSQPGCTVVFLMNSIKILSKPHFYVIPLCPLSIWIHNSNAYSFKILPEASGDYRAATITLKIITPLTLFLIIILI